MTYATRMLRGTARSTGTDTLALIERLLAEKDAPRYTLFNPGPVMTFRAGEGGPGPPRHCHRDEDYSGVVRRLAAEAAPRVRRVART